MRKTGEKDSSVVLHMISAFYEWWINGLYVPVIHITNCLSQYACESHCFVVNLLAYCESDFIELALMKILKK